MKSWQVLATAGLVAICSCGLVFDLEALGPGAADAGTDADAAPAIAGNEAGTDAPSVCPSLHGPPMIDADGQCIDSTEVTVADYEPFAATGPSVLPLPGDCSWVRTLTPSDFPAQRATPDAPVVNVNFCHALHYCKWAGKRLCGHVGGGSVAPGDAGANPHDNQWIRACTRDGRQRYSYGDVLAEGACPNEIGPVKRRGACGGAYPGLFDMLGNASEWIDGCETNGPTRERDGCTALGYAMNEASCTDLTEVSRYAVADNLGFRCCGP